MLGVAIVGAGHVGRIRAQVVRSSPGAEVRIVADVDPLPAQELADAVGARATTDWRGAVESSEIDIVIVSTPTRFHSEAVMAAFAAEKHVLCEKPMARSVAEAAEMVEAAKDSRRLLKTGFNYRYMAHVRAAKELIEGGALGPAYFLRCRFGHGGRPGYEKQWCTNQELSGGDRIVGGAGEQLVIVLYRGGAGRDQHSRKAGQLDEKQNQWSNHQPVRDQRHRHGDS